MIMIGVFHNWVIYCNDLVEGGMSILVGELVGVVGLSLPVHVLLGVGDSVAASEVRILGPVQLLLLLVLLGGDEGRRLAPVLLGIIGISMGGSGFV